MSTTTRLGYGKRTVDLSTAHDRKLYQIPKANHVSILRADHNADIRLQDKNNAPIPARDFGSIDFPDTPVDSLYVTNTAGSAGDELIILWSKGTVRSDPNNPNAVDITSRTTRDLGEVDVQDRSGREVGKARLEDSGGALIDPATNALEDALASNAADTFQVEQQTPVGVEDDTGTQIAPFNQNDATTTSASDSGTGSANAATLTLGDLRETVDVFVDTSGSATLTVEVSEDGGTTWRTFDTVSYSAATSEVEQYSVPWGDVRAYLDTARNAVVMSAKGV